MKVRAVLLTVATLCAASSAAATFVMKKEAEQDAREIGELNREIAAERQRISELLAEWSALDHPARLEALVERHGEAMGLTPIVSEQFGTVAQVASAIAAREEAAATDALEAEGEAN